MDNYKNYFNEAYKQLLLEKDFDFTKDGIAGDEGFKKFLDDDSTEHIDGVVEDEIIDTDAWNEDDLQKNYVGKVILECAVCHSRIYKDEDLVVLDEESGLANIEDECPVCNNSLGYTVIGKIEPFDDSAEDSDELDFPEEDEDEIKMPDSLPDDVDTEESDEEVEDTEEDEEIEKNSEGEVEEALKDRLQRKHLSKKESLDKDAKKSLNEDFYSDMRDLLGEGKEEVCPNCGKNPCVCEACEKDKELEEDKDEVCPHCGKNPCVCEGCEKDEALTEGADPKLLSKVSKDIEKAKNKLKGKKPRENFGQEEVRKLRDKYSDYRYGINHQVFDLINQFDDWCGNYTGVNESLDEAKLDEKLPKSLSSGRAKNFIQNKYNNIDFENSTFDEISPDDLSRMSRDERNNVITKHNYGTMGEIGQRGARSGKLVQQDWNDKLKNSNVSADDPEEVRRHLGSDGKIYRVNPVEKDPEKLASRVGNGHIAKANQYRKNAKDAFKENPGRYSWNDPKDQRASDLRTAQNYRNRAANAMDEPFANDPTIKDFRNTKNDVKLDKSWLNMSKDDEARYGDDVRSAELANEYGIRYARDVVDNEKRAKMYQDEAEKAKELGRKYMQTASDEEREEAKYNLDRATTRLNKTKERTAELETGIKDKLAGFKKRHSKEESLNEAPEGYNYENIYTPEEKENKDIIELMNEMSSRYYTLLKKYVPRLKKLQAAIEQAYEKTKFDWDRFAPQRDAYMYCMALQSNENSTITISGGDEYDFPIGLSIDIGTENEGYFTGWIDSTGNYDSDFDIDEDNDFVYVIDQLKDLGSSSNFLFEKAFKEAYNNLDACIKLAGYVMDESLNIVKVQPLSEAMNNVSVDTDTAHLNIESDDSGRVVVTSEPIMEGEFDDLAVDGEPAEEYSGDETIVPLEPSDEADIEINSDEENEEPVEEPLEAPMEGEEGTSEEMPTEEPAEEEELNNFENESFDYLGKVYMKRIYENVSDYKTTDVTSSGDKLMIEGLITFNSGATKKTDFVFDTKSTLKSGKVVLEGYNKTFSNDRAFKLRCSINEGAFMPEMLRYNYTVKQLNESTGKDENLIVSGKISVK